MSHSTLIALFSACCPWLALVWGFQALAGRCGLARRGWVRLSLLGLVAIGVLLVPVEGMPVAGWLRGCIANFSLPLAGLLAVAVWEAEFGARLFSGRDWTAGWGFGSLSGLGLYPFALGWGRFDPYEWGWSFLPLAAISTLLTGALLWKQNRFGLLLLLAVLAYNLRLLESTNYWDYLLDPVYCLVSIIALGWRLTPLFRPVNQ